MADIEWETESTLQPARRSLAGFCAQVGAPLPAAGAGFPLAFVSTRALDGLLAFLDSDTAREHGGVLVGLPYVDEDLGVTFVDVHAALPALDSQGSAVHLQFTAPTWAFISGVLAESYPDLAVVGWFHSHPGLGVFMSGTDVATQRAFYNQPWHLALVVDPLAQASAWFCGPDCIPLRPGQVIVYADGGAGEAEGPAAAPAPRRASAWRWLLPLAGVLLLWAVIRRKIKPGWSSV